MRRLCQYVNMMSCMQPMQRHMRYMRVDATPANMRQPLHICWDMCYLQICAMAPQCVSAYNMANMRKYAKFMQSAILYTIYTHTTKNTTFALTEIKMQESCTPPQWMCKNMQHANVQMRNPRHARSYDQYVNMCSGAQIHERVNCVNRVQINTMCTVCDLIQHMQICKECKFSQPQHIITYAYTTYAKHAWRLCDTMRYTTKICE